MNCFSILIKQYRNVVLVYLPLINQAVQRYKINHNQYQECIRIFLHYGTLEDINNLLDEQQDFAFFPKPSATLYTIEQVPPMYKNLDSEELMSKFDTSTRTLKDEWIEWMRNTSVELLKQSPMLVLSPCSSIAEMYPQLANELYNIAFDSVWQKLNDKHKE
jgi:FKBP12-rapamycin complex-associated protein